MSKISYDDKLHKGPVSTKLTRPHSTHSATCGVRCFKHFTNVSQSQRPSQSKKCTAADLWWLATANDEQSYQRLSQTSERVRLVRWWTFWAYDVNWVVARNTA